MPLSDAIKRIDPEGMLVPGTRHDNTIQELLQTWLDEFDSAETLEMARDSAKFRKTW